MFAGVRVSSSVRHVRGKIYLNYINLEKESKLDFSKHQGLTTEACGTSASNVFKMCKKVNRFKYQGPALFVSTRKSIDLPLPEQKSEKILSKMLYAGTVWVL
jgi:hypothetical protein